MHRYPKVSELVPGPTRLTANPRARRNPIEDGSAWGEYGSEGFERELMVRDVFSDPPHYVDARDKIAAMVTKDPGLVISGANPAAAAVKAQFKNLFISKHDVLVRIPIYRDMALKMWDHALNERYPLPNVVWQVASCGEAGVCVALHEAKEKYDPNFGITHRKRAFALNPAITENEKIALLGEIMMKMALGEDEPGEDDVRKDLEIELDVDERLRDQIAEGMATAVWYSARTTWAEDRLNGEHEDDEDENDDDEDELRAIARGDDDESPDATAEAAALWLLGALTKLNGMTIDRLLVAAARADQHRASGPKLGPGPLGNKRWPSKPMADIRSAIIEKYAIAFGHYVAMQSEGHGVSWFDYHAKFDLKLPAYFDAHTGDGTTVDWSGDVGKGTRAA
jgi:hypothetical protein